MSNRVKQPLVLIFHYTRCGSTLLSDLLSQALNTHVYGEILNHESDIFRHFIQTFGQNITIENIEIFIKDIPPVDNNTTKIIEITSYDLFLHPELDFFSLLERLSDSFLLKVIHLTRLNLLERSLSSCIAGASNKWHVPASEEYDVDKISLSQDLNWFKEDVYSTALSIAINRLALSTYDTLEVAYEDLVRGGSAINQFQVISKFLDLIHRDYSLRFKKLPKYSARVNNFDELMNSFLMDKTLSFFAKRIS